jgi:hypothetical protein
MRGGHRLLPTLLAALVMLAVPGGAGGRESPNASVTPTIYGTQGANGWYVTNVTINWVIEPLGYLGSEGCDAHTVAADTVGTPFTCHAWWPNADITQTITIKRDTTAPTVTVAPSRAPDANGWYNQPLAITFSGSDATSGVEACSQATYAGPDSAGASVSGTCRDRAGNVTPAAFALKYDATPPAIGAISVKPADRKAHLRWTAPQDAASVELARAPGLKGAAESVVFTGTGLAQGFTDRGLRPGRRYVYRLTFTDAAANHASKTLEYVARGALLNPAPGERVTKPPLLVWTPKRGASYYNLILVRGRRVFSAWPVQARMQLSRSWRYHGRRYRLHPGTYRWFVWPGRGPLSAGRYAKLLGGSTFTFGGSG